MDITKEYIKNAITKSLNIETTPSPTCNTITESINAEYILGRYHALLDILKDIDFDEFIEVHTTSQQRVEQLMQTVENLYHRRTAA